MTRRLIILAIATMATLGATHVFAHNEYRIIGTIVLWKDAQLEIKSREGKMVSITVNGETIMYRDNKKVKAAELKAGRHVVVDALGDSYRDLAAVEVRIIPSLPK